MKKHLLRAITLLLLLSLLAVSLLGCESYKPRKSTDKEATPVLTLGEDTVSFEALYTFFLNRCENTEGYSDTYFTGPEANARFTAILAEAVRELSEIYALFAVCREVGIDPYDEEVEELITAQIKLTVEGGVMDGVILPGYDSYDAYLDYLKASFHMNDAVNRLMLRYAVCEERLMDYYATTHTYTEADVRAFFDSEDCLRIAWVGRKHMDGGFLGLPDVTAEEIEAHNRDLLNKARNYFLSGNDNGAFGYTTRPETRFYVGRHTLDRAYYAELMETAYALPIGGVSEVMDLGTEGLFVIKRLAKDSADLASPAYYAAITNAYLYDLQMDRVLAKADALVQGIVYKDAYHSLTPADFTR